MTDAAPQPLAAALFLLLATSTAGIAHVLWLKSDVARVLAFPVDGGVRFRGRRLFGANKMVRGFVMMPLAAMVAFPLWAACWTAASPDALWPLQAAGFAVLGAACGLAFMLAELPNSFVKRQLDVAPGGVPVGRWMRGVFLVVDRFDSVLGVLAVAALLVPVPVATWAWVLVLGPGIHAVFSVVLHRLGVKARAL